MCFVTVLGWLHFFSIEGVLRVRRQQVAVSCQRFLWKADSGLLRELPRFGSAFSGAAETTFVLHLLLNTPFAKNKGNFRNNCIHLNDKTSFWSRHKVFAIFPLTAATITVIIIILIIKPFKIIFLCNNPLQGFIATAFTFAKLKCNFSPKCIYMKEPKNPPTMLLLLPQK